MLKSKYCRDFIQVEKIIKIRHNRMVNEVKEKEENENKLKKKQDHGAKSVV